MILFLPKLPGDEGSISSSIQATKNTALEETLRLGHTREEDT